MPDARLQRTRAAYDDDVYEPPRPREDRIEILARAIARASQPTRIVSTVK